MPYHIKYLCFFSQLLLVLGFGYAQIPCSIYSLGRQYIFLYGNGTFLEGRETMEPHIPYQYRVQDTVNYGTYTLKGSYFYLSSSQTIANVDSAIIQPMGKFPEDSIFVDINSPYCEIISENDQSCIYTFRVELFYQLGDSSVNVDIQEKIKDINFCFYHYPKSRIQKIRITIFPNEQFYQYNYSYNTTSHIEISIDSCSSQNNKYIVTLPNFNYLTLSYQNYVNYQIKRIGRNKLLFHGNIYTRYSAKRENRTRTANQILESYFR